MSSIKKIKDICKSKAACDTTRKGSKAGDEQVEDNKKTKHFVSETCRSAAQDGRVLRGWRLRHPQLRLTVSDRKEVRHRQSKVSGG